MVALIVLAIVIFGPDKLPKMVGEAARTIRKFREFSTNARTDLKKELGPEFENIKFEDLNPKTFVRKNLMGDDDDLGLKEFGDLRQDLTKQLRFDDDAAAGTPSLTKAPHPMEANGSRVQPGERPPYDADAT
ncbi:sec-independent translocase [Yinghuangia soli]|uniref:Sec-independent translocase n=1 Tax=Yinghuangia soli TaxID=2908204 RepID=A0AA41U4H5_9ACTN|nr:sec-independent translocase [Yinghuangia soli]